jgi:hypothetical protein
MAMGPQLRALAPLPKHRAQVEAELAKLRSERWFWFAGGFWTAAALAMLMAAAWLQVATA